MSYEVLENLTFVRKDNLSLTDSDKLQIEHISNRIILEFDKRNEYYEDISFYPEDSSITGQGSNFNFNENDLLKFSKELIPELIISWTNNTEGEETSSLCYIHNGIVKYPRIQSPHDLF